MIAEALRWKILDNTTVAELVGDRLYPEYERQRNKVYPLLVYKVDNDGSLITNSGANGYASCIFEIAAVASAYATVDVLAAALVTALDGARGTWEGIKVQGVFLQDDGIDDDIVSDPATEEILFYVKNLRYDVKYVR